jgi:hypothetical protein
MPHHSLKQLEANAKTEEISKTVNLRDIFGFTAYVKILGIN